MTAVDRPDNGHDEGRVRTDGHFVHCHWPEGIWCTCGALASGRAGAGEQQREAVARWLFAHDGSTPSAWDRLLNDAGKRVWLRYADELLSLLDRTQPD